MRNRTRTTTASQRRIIPTLGLGVGLVLVGAACSEGEGPAGTGGALASGGVAATGGGRWRSVQLAPGGGRDCDMLVLGFSQPSYELAAQAGRLATLGGDPPIVTMEGPARIELDTSTPPDP